MAAPPTYFPINPPTTMRSGVPTVVGGLRPGSARAAADLTADLVARHASGQQLMSALAAVRTRTAPTLHDWGLAVHGYG
jgi:hypothetical protein